MTQREKNLDTDSVCGRKLVVLLLYAHANPITAVFWEMLTAVELPEYKVCAIWKIRPDGPMRAGIDG